MRQRLEWACLLVLASSSAIAAEPASKPEKARAVDVFGPTKLHQVQLVIGAKDYAAMDPPQPAFGGPPAAGRGGPAPGSPDFGAGKFGFEFEYVKAEAQLNGELLKDVGLRYKGNGTYLVSSRGAKRSFKVDFDRYDPKQQFRGLKKLNLNSGVMDPTKAREALAYSVFRAAGVPTPQTAFAEVTLTVPGKYDQQYLGVYTLVEQVDKAFLQEHFRNGKGLLLKPEGIRGLPFLGDSAAAYEKSYNAKSGESEAGWKRLLELTQLINQADDARFRKEIGVLLDVEGFSRFLAASTMLATLDGFTGLGHNYYLYLSPETDSFHFFPWDLDLAFGGFFMYGSPEQQADLSIEHPHMGDNKLIDRLLAMPDFKSAYREHLRRLNDEVFSPDKLGRDIAAVESLLKPLIAKDKQAADARKEGGSFPFGPPGPGGAASPPNSLSVFMNARKASVAAQLGGRTQAFVPTAGSGFGGPPPGGGGNPLAKPLLDALDANKDGQVTEEEFAAGTKKLFREWDKEGKGKLDQKQIEAGLQRLLPRPTFGPPSPK